MFKKCKSFLYVFDLIGESPQLYIFNNRRYKSIFTSFISFIIILFSFTFTVISFAVYLEYENPIISYSKGSDEYTKRAINIKDTFLMFQLIDSTTIKRINSSIAYYDAEYQILYENGSSERESLDIEICELGKNIDSKFEEFINDKSNFDRKVNEFYCIGSKNRNLSLFYHPNIGYSFINLAIIFKNNSEYIPEKIQALIVSENNLINHKSKDNPIRKSYSYQITSGFNSLEFTSINYNFQYIKYESDDGFFFKNNKNFSGIAFSDSNFYRNFRDDYDFEKNLKNKDFSKIGNIAIALNKSSFDYYKRNYQRIQSLLAEVMSMISLVFEIGRQISVILFNKKMTKEIIRSILNKDKNYISEEQNHKKNKLSNIQDKNKSSIRNLNSELFDKTNSSDILNKSKEKNYNNKLNESNNNNLYKVEKIKKINLNNRILKKLNYYHILKSFFCFKDNKTKLINLCQKIITEDMCIERILERFYNLEKIYHFLSHKEKEKYNNNKFKEILKYISKINDETKNEICFNKEDSKNNLGSMKHNSIKEGKKK